VILYYKNLTRLILLIVSEVVEVKVPEKQKPEMIVLDDINDDVSIA